MRDWCCGLGRAYLVLKVDGSVEVRDLCVGRGADHLALGSVHEGAHLKDLGRRALGSVEGTAATCAIRLSVTTWSCVYSCSMRTSTATAETSTSTSATTAAERHFFF